MVTLGVDFFFLTSSSVFLERMSCAVPPKTGVTLLSALGAVLGTSLLPIGHTGGIQRPPDDVVADAG